MNLGTVDIDFQRYSTQANGILGIRGSGKTFSATYIAEQLLEWGCPLCVIDPSGTWKNLKIPNGENGKGYNIVTIGNEDSDIFINDDFNTDDIIPIVTLALEKNVSIIFDLYRTELTKEKWGDILTLAFQTIYLKNRGIRHILIEEAASFIPQNQKAFSKELYSILEEITRVGGNAQLGITFVSQRAEQLNKQCLDLCDLMILHRQRGNNSLKTIKNWLGMGVVNDEDIENVLKSIPTLNTGEAWVLEQNSQTPHRINVPAKNSLHPDRARFTQEYLNKSTETSISDFISDVGSLQSPQNNLDTLSLENLVLYTTQNIENEHPEIDITIDESKLGYIDRHIIHRAKNMAYGSSTVKDVIDDLVRRGYTKFNATFRYLESQYENSVFGLDDSVSFNYAKLLISKLQ
jgi:hypothetical protein